MTVAAFQVALGSLWRSLGFVPDAVVGLGAGQVAAAFVAEELGLSEAIEQLAQMRPDEPREPEGTIEARLAASLGEDSTIFLEIAPRAGMGPTLRALLERHAAVGAAVPSLVPGQPERASLLEAVAALYCLGVAVDWRRLDPPATPGAPVPPAAARLPSKAPDAPLPPSPVLVPTWEPAPPPGGAAHAHGDWLLVGADDELARALAEALHAAGHHVRSVADPERVHDLLVHPADRGVIHILPRTPPDLSRALDVAERGLAATTRVFQALVRQPTRQWLITRGAQVLPGDNAVGPIAGATLWGFGRVAANELPRLRCTLIDLDDTPSVASDAALLVRELLADGVEQEIAYRRGDRYVARVRPHPSLVPKPGPSTRRVRSDGAWLLTGGLGGLGLSAARVLVARGARRLVLVGRSGVVTDLQRVAIAELEATGASVVVERADVSRREELAAVLARHPVRSVLHAAGAMTPSTVVSLRPGDFAAVLAAKVRGALALHELTAGQRLDDFVLYSSVAALLGTPGQAAYAAANAYLDALAAHRRAVGLAGQSIAWTVITETGMAANAGARAVNQLADRGLGSLSLSRSAEVLDTLLGLEDGPPHVGIAPFNLERWATFYPPTAPRLAPLGVSVPRPHARPMPPAAPPVVDEGSSGASPTSEAALAEWLGRTLVAVLHHPGELGPSDTLGELGLDSLTALELSTLTQQELRIELTVERLLRGGTIGELAKELLNPHEVVPRGPSLHDEAHLGPRIVRPPTGALPASPPNEILLTGATGFLGAFLLHELLLRTDATIHCLVRAPSPAQALRRLETTLQRYDLPTERLAARVRCCVGDLARPGFGLDSHELGRLTEEVDAVFHCGASVNFVSPYEALRAANVDATRDVRRLLTTGRPKRLHHVSTIGVFPAERGPSPPLSELQLPGQPERLALGYMRSKWVAEMLVREAGERGLPVVTYRPGTITGHSVSGAFNMDDFLCVLIRGCVELGLAPRVNVAVNLAPVDYVSRALVDIALGRSAPTGAFHLVGPTQVSWMQIVDWVRGCGYPLEDIPYTQWRAVVLERAEPTQSALTRLLPLFRAHEDTAWLELPAFDTARTDGALAGSGVSCPSVDRALFVRYVERFVASGFLPGASA